jgi:predicted GIY-YIG superfamily endonuclease
MAGGRVHVITNKLNGILYTVVTSGLQARAWQHREGMIDISLQGTATLP